MSQAAVARAATLACGTGSTWPSHVTESPPVRPPQSLRSPGQVQGYHCLARRRYDLGCEAALEHGGVELPDNATGSAAASQVTRPCGGTGRRAGDRGWIVVELPPPWTRSGRYRRCRPRRRSRGRPRRRCLHPWRRHRSRRGAVAIEGVFCVSADITAVGLPCRSGPLRFRTESCCVPSWVDGRAPPGATGTHRPRGVATRCVDHEGVRHGQSRT
jgi:hypothetical protein